MLLVKSCKGGEGSGTKRRPRHPPDSLHLPGNLDSS